MYWICVEMIGQQGKKYRLTSKEDWKNALKDVSKVEKEKIEKLLTVFAQENLICHKALEIGDLYIPKMKDYADEYSVRRSGEYRENVVLDKIRIDKIRIEYIKLKGLDIKNFFPDDFGRTAKAIKTLVIKARGKDEIVIEALQWIASQTYEWTLETLSRKWADFMKYKQTPDLLKKYGQKEERLT